MSYAEIEAELHKLGSDDLRRLALKSWTAFVRKAGRTEGTNFSSGTLRQSSSCPAGRMDFKVIFKDTFLADLELAAPGSRGIIEL